MMVARFKGGDIVPISKEGYNCIGVNKSIKNVLRR